MRIHCVLIDGTVRKFPVARIQVESPYYIGEVSALCIKDPVYDLIIGNVPGARPAFEPNDNWKPGTGNVSNDNSLPDELQAVETRAMKVKAATQQKPLSVPCQIADVSFDQFLEEQATDPSLVQMWARANGADQKSTKYRFAIKIKILIRERTDDPANVTSQVVVPTKYRETVMKELMTPFYLVV